MNITIGLALEVPYNNFSDLQRNLKHPMYIWLPVLFLDVILATYCSSVILPLWSMLITSGVAEPAEMHAPPPTHTHTHTCPPHTHTDTRAPPTHTLTHAPSAPLQVSDAKRLDAEEEHGISGLVLKGLNYVFVGDMTHVSQMAKTFIVSLADQVRGGA